MIRTALIAIAGLILLGIVAVGLRLYTPIAPVTVTPFDAPASDGPHSAAEISSAPSVTVTGFVTGWVLAPADILIETSDPRTPDALKSDQLVPSVAYLVEHPTRGSVLFDLGVRAGPCSYGLRPLYFVPCNSPEGAGLVSQMLASGHDPAQLRAIIPSHMHGDHVSGLADVLANVDAPLLMTDLAIAALRSPMRALGGHVSSHLQTPMQIQSIDAAMSDDPLLGSALDLFGDGSVYVFSTSGHASGHVSALLRGPDHPVLLTFDASHLAANLELGIPTGLAADPQGAREALARLQTITQAIPDLEVVYGHEPTQWTCDYGRRRLGITDAGYCEGPARHPS